MTGKAGKGQNKAKPNRDPAPMVRGNITVRDCMTWRYQEGFDQNQSDSQQQPQSKEHYLPTKPDLGRAKNRGYEMPPPAHYDNTHDDDGRVIDALRGWPNHRQNSDEAALDEYGQINGCDQGMGDNRKGDPWMGDLISHKFLMDALRKREEEEAAARKAAKEKAKKANPGKNDIKSNRTAQLRAIAMAEKVEVSPHDLWQMPKFKNNARPHLTTTGKHQQQKQQTNGGTARVGSSGSVQYGNGDPCTCYDNDQGMYDAGRPESNNSYRYNYDGPVNHQMDDPYGDDNDVKMFDL